MKHELVQARNATGMKLTGQNSMLCGFYRGYGIVTNLNSKNRCYDVLVWASRPGEDFTAPTQQWASDYTVQHPFCTAAGYNGQMLAARIAIDKKRDITAQSLLTFYNDVTGWLAANGMVTVCENCGAGDASLYNLGGKLHAICPRCLDQMSQAAKADQKAAPGNLPAGIVGALLFSLAGVALWVLINRLGYVAAICGLVLMVCAFKGYEKFSKKLDMPGIIACIIVAIFMGMVSQFICITLDAYEVFSEYGLSLLETAQLVPLMLIDPEMELATAYLPDLLMGYLFMAIGSFSFVRNAIAAQKYGGFRVECLAKRPEGYTAAPAAYASSAASAPAAPAAPSAPAEPSAPAAPAAPESTYTPPAPSAPAENSYNSNKFKE